MELIFCSDLRNRWFDCQTLVYNNQMSAKSATLFIILCIHIHNIHGEHIQPNLLYTSTTTQLLLIQDNDADEEQCNMYTICFY